MNYLVKVSDGAKLELHEAVIWYELQQAGLGDRFLIKFDRYLQIIQKNPKLFSKKKKEYREVLIRPFPFLIVYRIDKERARIVIVGVFHTKRHPRKKYHNK